MRHCKNCNGLNNDVDTNCVVCNNNIDGVETINVKGEAFENPVQKATDKLSQLKKCVEEDSTANSLFRISDVVFTLGVAIAFIQLIALSFLATLMQKQPPESFSIAPIISAFVYFFIITGAAWMFSLFLKAIAQIVQNTKNSTKILEYQTKLLIENQGNGV